MITDVAFRIGASHEVCQDYGRAFETGIAISDGCSSSPDSDVGARLLAGSFMTEKFHRYDTFSYRPDFSPGFYGFGETFWDATLLVAGVHEGMVHIRMGGDGFVCVTFRDGRRVMCRVDFENNAPYYPSYLWNEKRQTEYLARFGGRSSVEWLDLKQPFPDGSEAKATDFYPHRWWVFPADTVTSVILATDGIFSFARRDGQYLDPMEPIEELLAFPQNVAGCVRRRLGRAEKKFARDGIVHHDDITVGGLFL